MKLFPIQADFMVFDTGYTDRVLDEHIQQLQEEEETTYFGKIVFDDCGKKVEPNFTPIENEEFLKTIKNELDENMGFGSLVFSTENIENEVNMTNICLLIDNVNRIISYCACFSIDTLYQMEIKEIFINEKKYRVLYLYFDTESG